MASWGTRRRNTIIFLLITVFILLSFAFVSYFYYEEPTCFDGEQNGNEEGVDCGGNCSLLCTGQTFDPIVHWKRYFEIDSGVYNVIAYIENQNPAAGATDVEYSFKLYDKNNVILVEKKGIIDIKPNQITPIIENNLSTGKLRAARVDFEFTEEINWFKQKPLDNLVSIQNQQMTEVDGLPRITATVSNNTNGLLEDILFIVIVYDRDGNAIATSNSTVFRLEREQSENIIYTWPYNFPGEATRFEIIPIYDFGN